MDDRNPLSFEQVQQKLADSRTLDASIDALREMQGVEGPPETWDELARLALVGIVVRHAELGVRFPKRGGCRRSPGSRTRRSTGKKRPRAGYGAAKRSTCSSEHRGPTLGQPESQSDNPHVSPWQSSRGTATTRAGGASARHGLRLGSSAAAHDLGTVGRNHQQSSRRSFRTPSALFPVLESRHTHADHRGEFRLRLAKLLV